MQRTLENRGFQLNRQGKIPFASASEGHEAVQAGAAMAFERGRDILVPYYRDSGSMLGIGLTPYEVLLSLFARAADHQCGRQFPHHYASRRSGLHTISSIIAAQLPHAVGAAYAMKYRKEGGQRRTDHVRRRRDERRRVARIAQLRRRPPAADRLPLREQRVGDLDAACANRWRSPTSTSARGLRHTRRGRQRHGSDRVLRRRQGERSTARARAAARRWSRPSATAFCRIRPTTTTAPTARAKKSRNAAKDDPVPQLRALPDRTLGPDRGRRGRLKRSVLEEVERGHRPGRGDAVPGGRYALRKRLRGRLLAVGAARRNRKRREP